MSVIRNPCIASPEALARLSFFLSPSQGNFQHPLDSNSAGQSYKIELTRDSESATVLFLRHVITERQVVIKILNKYRDTRYNLDKRAERQKCQLKALYWNREFTPDIYAGLARIRSFDPQHTNICIDEIIPEPNIEMLDPHAEYGLVIQELPLDRQLDNLLEKEKDNTEKLEVYVELLAKRIAHLHENVNPTILHSSSENIYWGSIEQLKEKLEHNLAFTSRILTKIEPEHYNFYDYSLNSIKNTLTHVLKQEKYQNYFKQRVREGYIKRCHADLKGPNIWIASIESLNTKLSDTLVWILDAIDFNDLYSNIDILSDIATLIVDIEARTKSHSIANHLLKKYLEFSKQQDPTARFVLNYYLVEKALVGAILAIGYDDLPELGLSFLEVAEIRSKYLLDKKIAHATNVNGSTPLESLQLTEV